MTARDPELVWIDWGGGSAAGYTREQWARRGWPRCRYLGHGIARVLTLLREAPGVWCSERELAAMLGLHEGAVDDALRIIQEAGIRLEVERACAVDTTPLPGMTYEPATLLWRLP